IDAASEGDTVLVQPGIYLEHLAILNKNITLASLFLTTADTSYISTTIIDGDTSGRVIYADGLTSETVIAGLTLRNGKTSDEPGGGLHIAGSSPTISYMVIRNNTAMMGGGIFCDGATLNVFNTLLMENVGINRAGGIMTINSDITLENCAIFDNHAPNGAGMNCLYNNDEGNFYIVNIQSCDYSDNVASGSASGLFIGKLSGNAIVDVVLDECTFTDNITNGNGALQIRGEEVDFRMLNCRITGNTSNTFTAGAGFLGGCTGEMANCLIANNIAATGGGYWNSGGVALWADVEVIFDNCTFADNFAPYGGGLTVAGSGAYFVNSIFWGNSNQQIAVVDFEENGGGLFIDYCDMQYGFDSIRVDPYSTLAWGDHNITGDPMFVDSGEEPYELSSSSPCIDTGTPDTTGMNLLPFDILGNIRVWDGSGGGTAIIDMGAYEYGAPVWVGIDDPEPIPKVASMKMKVYPNPCREYVILSFDVDESQRIAANVFSIRGERVMQVMDETVTSGSFEASIPLIDLSPGIYFIRVSTPDKTGIQKLIVL
ncbi:MAG: hypothetical protein DRJ15_17925, partial [Bacteroidetes bacterium]